MENILSSTCPEFTEVLCSRNIATSAEYSMYSHVLNLFFNTIFCNIGFYAEI